MNTIMFAKFSALNRSESGSMIWSQHFLKWYGIEDFVMIYFNCIKDNIHIEINVYQECARLQLFNSGLVASLTNHNAICNILPFSVLYESN